MLRAIIFDLDGTLVDAYPGIHQSLNEMLRELQLPEVDLQTVKRRVGRGVVNLMQQSVPSEMVDRALPLFRNSYDHTHLSGTFLFRMCAKPWNNCVNATSCLVLPAISRRILREIFSNIFISRSIFSIVVDRKDISSRSRILPCCKT